MQNTPEFESQSPVAKKILGVQTPGLQAHRVTERRKHRRPGCEPETRQNLCAYARMQAQKLGVHGLDAAGSQRSIRALTLPPLDIKRAQGGTYMGVGVRTNSFEIHAAHVLHGCELFGNLLPKASGAPASHLVPHQSRAVVDGFGAQ